MSEKQDPNTVNENVISQSDKYWCSENSCDVHDFTLHNLKVRFWYTGNASKI